MASQWMTEKKLERLFREADKWLDGFGIDRDILEEPYAIGATTGDEGINISHKENTTVEVRWRSKETGAEIVLTAIYWNERSGKILQAGTQGGDLVM